MRVVLQRVKHAKCTIDGNVSGEISQGYLLLVGFTHTDVEENLSKAAKKIANLRIFEDDNGKMNLNINAVNGKILSISQFTLYADTNQGNRPSFVNAMNPTSANELYLSFNEKLREYGLIVEEGIFGEDMKIDLLNDGPCTIVFDF